MKYRTSLLFPLAFWCVAGAPLTSAASDSSPTEPDSRAGQTSTSLETSAVEPDEAYAEEGRKQTWLDDTHEYVSTSADDFANWIDHFFGSPRDDIETANSTLRLTLENDWEESEGSDSNVRLRGKVHLPRLNERLSLLFTDEDGETTKEEEALNELTNRPESTRVSLQYTAKEKQRYRIDYRLGLRSSLKARASVRYRYQLPVNEKTTHRLTETLYFIDGEGFGSRTRYELDYLLKEEKLLRWSNSARFAEDTDGVEWTTQLTLGKRRGEKSAISGYTWLRGETRPEDLTTSYGVGLRYRRNFHRPWLFYELEPAYAWKRDEIAADREGVFLFSVRLEILLEQEE